MLVLNVSSSSNCPSDYSLADHVVVAKSLVGVNICASILGILGNLLVCIAVFTTQGMTSSFHYFISSLAAADLTVALVDQPLFITLIIARINAKCLPDVDFAFRVVGNFACAVSLLTLALIALDRCLYVSPKFNYKNTMTAKKKIVLAVVWLLACVYSAIRVTLDKEITSYLTATVFGICYVEMIACYSIVYYQVFKQRKRLAASRVQNSVRTGAVEQAETLETEAENNTTERRFARTIVMVLVVFTAGWFLLFYLRLTQPKKNYGIMYNVARTVAFSSSSINPVLYCFNNKEYRQAFKRISLRLFLGGPKKRREKYQRIK
ncbi:Melanocortin receptor 5 [Desmophyllum pertusum]|uniref:Melanocortin receptor 5 n=1 Tax=Desmophyllum pertusum TaxID=174260 RepID=A0A9X0CTB0_9CNID|nr:Melanocortin receptor 5 [Desmophyllum pertusum]